MFNVRLSFHRMAVFMLWPHSNIDGQNPLYSSNIDGPNPLYSSNTEGQNPLYSFATSRLHMYNIITNLFHRGGQKYTFSKTHRKRRSQSCCILFITTLRGAFGFSEYPTLKGALNSPEYGDASFLWQGKSGLHTFREPRKFEWHNARSMRTWASGNLQAQLKAKWKVT